MKEWHRTVVLIVLLIAVVALVLYVKGDFEKNALETLR